MVRHSIIIVLKLKTNFLKHSKRQHLTYRKKQNKIKFLIKKNMDTRKRWHSIFQVLKEKNGQSKVRYPMTMSLGYLGYGYTLKEYQKHVNRKGITKEGNLKHRKDKGTWPEKIWMYKIVFNFPLELSKLCLMAEAKMILFNVVLNVCI